MTSLSKLGISRISSATALIGLVVITQMLSSPYAVAAQLVSSQDCNLVMHVPGVFGGTDLHLKMRKGSVFTEDSQHKFCGSVTQATPLGESSGEQCFVVSDGKLVSGKWSNKVTASDCVLTDAATGVVAIAEQGPPPADSRAGCIGADLRACVAAVASVYDVTASPGGSVEEQLASKSQLDVNGKPLTSGASTISISFKQKNAPRYAPIESMEVNYTDFGLVERIAVPLWRDPLSARTPAEYDSTGIWEAALIAGGHRCAASGKLATYQLFENQLKPNVTYGEKKYTITDTSAETSREGHTPEVPACGGLKVSYIGGFGVDTSTITTTNPHGVYAISLLVFADPTVANRVFLGVRVLPPNNPALAKLKLESAEGLYIIAIQVGGAADKAGVKAGDFLLRVGDKPVNTAADLQAAIAGVTRGETISIEVLRQHTRSTIEVHF